MDRMYDVIVVGAGVSGGLPAAAYLQRAGASVLLLERSQRAGTFFHAYERAPGVWFDVAPVNNSTTSPAIVDLDLAAYDYEVDFPPVTYSVLDGRGRTTTFRRDLGATVAALGVHSSDDAAVFERLVPAMRRNAREILTAAFFTPDPDLDRAIDLTAQAVQIPRSELERLNALELIERLFTDDAVRIAVMAARAVNLHGDLLAPGQGALAWLWGFVQRGCRAVRRSSSLPDALQRRFLDVGGTLMFGAEVTEFVTDPDGGCTGVVAEVEGRRQAFHARHAVVSNLGADLTSALLGEDLRPGWRSSGRTVFTADLVLDRPLDWGDDGFAASPYVYRVWDSWDACAAWFEAAGREEEAVFLGHLELTQFHVMYGSGEGGTPLRLRFGTGPFIDDDWEARRPHYEEVARDVVASIDDRVAIRSLDLSTPLDYWRRNPAATHGNPVGGDFTAEQWLGTRLPYRTATDGLYLSNSVWPTSLSWMAPGYNAAWAVAEDLGIRDQPWWTSPPLPDLTP